MSLKKISDLFNFEKGSLQSTKCTPGEFNFITASSEWKTHNEYTHECEALIFAAAASGSLGRTHYVNGKFISSDLCFIIIPKDPVNFPIDIKFYHLIFETFKEDIVKNTKAGTSKEAIGLKSFGNYKLPYFEISKQISTREQFVNVQIYKTELVSEFTHQLDLIKQLRQAFLREAMQGKLTAKWRESQRLSGLNVEPASVLLKKIKAEKEKLVKEGKLKKDKPLPAIKEDEIPFEFPESWEWCRLGETSYITSGSTPQSSAFVNEGIPYLKMYNLRNQKIDFFYKPQYIKEEVHNGQLKRCRAYPGDILMNIVGPPLGKIAIIPDFFTECNFNQAAVLIRPYLLNLNVFIFWYLNEMSEINSIETKGVAGQNNISVTQAHNMRIPLPPISEQQQIVTKLDELMKYCDDLEESIKTSRQHNEMLLQQVLREALEPDKYKTNISV